jgi:enoyl-CoA hydratase
VTDALIHVEIGTHAPRVAMVTLADGEHRNAITPDMNAQLLAAFDALEADAGVGAVVVTGQGSSFCAGANLSHLGDTPSQDGLRSIYEGFLRVAHTPLPTIAAVNGPAVGAGMNLALCCDVRLAGAAARFDTRFLQLGIHPGGGHTWMLRRAVGPQAAMAAVLFGEVLSAAEAERHGLVWKCLPDDELLGAAVTMAERAAAAPPELAKRVKQSIIHMANVETHEQAVTDELAVQWWSMAQPEFAERVRALQQKISKS